MTPAQKNALKEIILCVNTAQMDVDEVVLQLKELGISQQEFEDAYEADAARKEW